ncbi:hypothetical protein [Photorhabdus heterorhabditis]|uniref:hypothetical protein n=1 Tax=Photorhabdus heterorhabditis TaxID=880156 RepID=UPI001561D4E3|nr:hypothetical protein [Photorhabdus heterorhabditis]NRN29687.1 hypothetical protein [Photorhabdus heterorhabditis subsp. aluminescens]
MQSTLDYLTYGITAVVFLSIYLEGRRTRYPRTLFYFSLVLLAALVVIGGLNWWLYRSFYGLMIVAFTVYALIGTRFRLMVYSLRFSKLVANLKDCVGQGKRVILVLPDNAEEKQVLLSLLAEKIPVGQYLYTPFALGLSSSDVSNQLIALNDLNNGYVLACEDQLQSRTWLNLVENGEPETSIAVNFHHIPDLA